jgi:hypothetical protein
MIRAIRAKAAILARLTTDFILFREVAPPRWFFSFLAFYQRIRNLSMKRASLITYTPQFAQRSSFGLGGGLSVAARNSRLIGQTKPTRYRKGQ